MKSRSSSSPASPKKRTSSGRATSDINYYPVFLNLKGKKCVVVGGGAVAERKAMAFLKAGARVIVVSPSLTSRLTEQKARGRLSHVERNYKKGDLKGAFLVISATDSYEENKKVASDAGAVPVNVVDTPELCSFIVPSTVMRGPLVIAISTSGASPALSRAIRKELESLYPPRTAGLLKVIREKRSKAMAEIKDAGQRRRYLKSLGTLTEIRRLRQR